MNDTHRMLVSFAGCLREYCMFRLIIIPHGRISTMSSPLLMGAVWTDPSSRIQLDGGRPDGYDNGRPAGRIRQRAPIETGPLRLLDT